MYCYNMPDGHCPRFKGYSNLAEVIRTMSRAGRPFMNIIVVADVDDEPAYTYPYAHGEHLLYMGEVSGMRGHVIVANKRGQVFWGYHADNFYVVPETEL